METVKDFAAKVVLAAVLILSGCRSPGASARDAASDQGFAPPETAEARPSDVDAADAIDNIDNIDSTPAPDAVPDGVPEAAPPGRAFAVAIAVGTEHACALLEDHRLKCWGSNAYGQLGTGDKQRRGLDPAQMGDALPAVDLGTGRRATAIAAGRYVTCAILDSGAVKCWGIGILTGLRRTDLVGDEPGEMGDNLPAVDLGPGRTARQVAVGYSSSCALLDDDTIRCWGSSDGPFETPLDAGTKASRLVGALSVLAVFDGGGVGNMTWQSEPNLTGRFSPVAAGGPVRALAGSVAGACAILERGGINCWNYNGQIGGVGGSRPPMTPNSVVAMAISQFGIVCGLLSDGGVRCWRGAAARVPTTTGPSDAEFATGALIDLGGPATAVAGGGFDHTCALMKTGEVKCWTWSTGRVAAVGTAEDGQGGLVAVDLGSRLP